MKYPKLKKLLICIFCIGIILCVLSVRKDAENEFFAEPSDIVVSLNESTPSPTATPTKKPHPSPIPVPTDEVEAIDSAFRVHFIDVGQGESILIEDHKHYMLIDGGLDDKGKQVVKYLQQLGVEELEIRLCNCYPSP